MFQLPPRSGRYLVLALLGLLILLPALTMPDLRWNHVISTPPGPGVSLIYQLKPPSPPGDQRLADQAAAIVQNRIDPDQISDIAVRPLSPDTIEVDVVGPLLQQLDQMQAMIAVRGILEFHIVESAPWVTEMIRQANNAGIDPASLSTTSQYRWFAFEDTGEARNFRNVATWKGVDYALVLMTPDASMPPLSGWSVERAYPTVDASGAPAVGFEFDPRGGRLFGDLTTRWRPSNGNLYQLAVILDDCIITAPSIDAPIVGGSGIITGGGKGFTPERAAALANLLRAGPLPAPLVLQSMTKVALMTVTKHVAQPLAIPLFAAGGIIFLAGIGSFAFKWRSRSAA
ncbi:MAG TPA: hypothetical protein VMD30_01455 [Tepidisphaeraceae bacterium]|nr:hypothetical protein [Tepidisphaeraceae bacterium]